jgi:hypothetical protein
MTEGHISIDELLKKHNLQPHDLEYILNFMKKEDISPQLAMRRIKLFEKLQEKMEQSQSDDKVQELTSELDHLSKVVEDLQKEKNELDKEIEETRLQQDLFNAEREELKMQMHALMNSIETIETEAEKGEEQLEIENQDLKKKISLMTAGCQTLKDNILKLGSENPSVRSLVHNLEKSLNSIIDAKQFPRDVVFTAPTEITATIRTPESTPPPAKTEEAVTETISPEQIKFVTPSKVPESAPPTESVGSRPIESKPVTPKRESILPPESPEVEEKPAVSSRPVIKEKIFEEPPEVTEPVAEPEPQPEPEPVPVTEPKTPIEHKPKPKPKPKPEVDGRQVSAKIEKILRLFISYAQQADTDENWKARIAAICDMDEAYIELGGLAMSQIYAYQTQSLKKKKEFERLIRSWIENGLPR